MPRGRGKKVNEGGNDGADQHAGPGPSGSLPATQGRGKQKRGQQPNRNQGMPTPQPAQGGGPPQQQTQGGTSQQAVGGATPKPTQVHEGQDYQTRNPFQKRGQGDHKQLETKPQSGQAHQSERGQGDQPPGKPAQWGPPPMQMQGEGQGSGQPQSHHSKQGPMNPQQPQQPVTQADQKPKKDPKSIEPVVQSMSDLSVQGTPAQPKAPKERNKYKKKVAEPEPAVSSESALTKPPERSPSVASSTSSVAPSSTSSVAPPTPQETSSSSLIKSAALIPVAPHKGSGTCGTKITIDVNYLMLNIQKLIPFIYHYDVNIEPNMPKRNLPHVFEEFRKLNFPKVFLAFDGQKNAFSPSVLDLSKIKERKIMYKGDDSFSARAYMVNIKEVKESFKIDMQPLKEYTKSRQFDQPARCLQAIEIVLKAVFLAAKGVTVGRSFYKPLIENGKAYDLGDNYDLWTGLFQSTVLGNQPYLNVDIAHKAFPRPILLTQMLCDMRIDISRPPDMRYLSSFINGLKGLRILYQVTGHPETMRSYKFNGLGDPPNVYKFKNEDGKLMTIVEYMRVTYKATLKYPHLPSVWVGNTDRKTYLPIEFCSVSPGQAVMKKCTEMQTRNMIKVAATSTDVRRKKIMDMLRAINHNANPTLQQFGVSVGNEFSSIQARVMAPPTLQYADNRTVIPRKGVWEMAGTFLYPVELQNWAILTLDQRAHEGSVREFPRMIVNIGANYNMKIAPEPKFVRMRSGFRDADIDREMEALKKGGCALLFCIISNFGDHYARVKQAAEIRCGILTQCIKENTLTRKGQDKSTITNILLKVNAKLNGTNHKFSDRSKLPIQRRPHMVIGADVTHPSPEQTRIPSVVGVAFSNDANSFRYRMSWRLQNPKQEMIQDLEEMLIEQLNLFKAQNGIMPETLLYYRDGVSEGQFQEVMQVELLAMYRACARVQDKYKPKIVFVVVQKRHHTRFFPKVPNRADRNNNVEPGTIVDSQITHPNETQFFLVSHASIQGVAKPTKYCLLHDDAKMSIDDLETFTYNLCHLFTRCNRAVSYPAPTYYAHLAAYRGRVYIEGQPLNMDKLQKEYNDRRTSDDITRKNPMYFV